MSFIRSLEERKYSNGDSGLYVYPTQNPETQEQMIEFSGDCIPSEDFVEILFRIFERGDLEFSLEQINKVRGVLYLEPLDAIIDEYEATKAYWEPLGIQTKEEYEKWKRGEDDKDER